MSAFAAEVLTAQRRPRARPPLIVVVSMVCVVVAILAAILAPLIAPYNPNAVDLLGSFAGPSAHHLLGEDSSGRDILSRLIYGARLSLLGPLLVVGLAAVVGVPLGLASGYARSWIDGLLSRLFDVMFAFPSLLLAIVVVATFGLGFRTAVCAVALTYIPLVGRVVRAATLVERAKPYVEACELQGFGALRITGFHIGPNIARLIIGQVALFFGYALLDLAGLSFLGLGAQPPAADWGTMLWDANGGIFESPTGVIPPAVAIVLIVVSFNLIADWIVEMREGSR